MTTKPTRQSSKSASSESHKPAEKPRHAKTTAAQQSAFAAFMQQKAPAGQTAAQFGALPPQVRQQLLAQQPMTKSFAERVTAKPAVLAKGETPESRKLISTSAATSGATLKSTKQLLAADAAPAKIAGDDAKLTTLASRTAAATPSTPAPIETRSRKLASTSTPTPASGEVKLLSSEVTVKQDATPQTQSMALKQTISNDGPAPGAQYQTMSHQHGGNTPYSGNAPAAPQSGQTQSIAYRQSAAGEAPQGGSAAGGGATVADTATSTPSGAQTSAGAAAERGSRDGDLATLLSDAATQLGASAKKSPEAAATPASQNSAAGLGAAEAKVATGGAAALAEATQHGVARAAAADASASARAEVAQQIETTNVNPTVIAQPGALPTLTTIPTAAPLYYAGGGINPAVLQQVVEYAAVTRRRDGKAEFRLGLSREALGGARLRVASCGEKRVELTFTGGEGPNAIGQAEVAQLVEALRARGIEVVDVKAG